MMSMDDLKETLKKANKMAKELIKINDLNYHRFLAMRSRLAVLTVMHKTELDGMGICIDRWLRALELDKRQLSALTMGFKKRRGE